VRDVDGDGFADIVLGWQVWRGGREGLAAGRVIEVPHGEGELAMWGAVTIVGDVDGDGLADLMRGDPACPLQARDMPECGVGQVWLYRGERGGLAAEPSQTLTAAAADTWFGGNIMRLGDVDGDGRDDVAVIARDHAHVYLGAPGGVSATPIELSSVALFAVGDIDGDGAGELVAVSPQSLTLYRGGAGGPSDDRITAVPMPLNSEVYGTAAGGDFDGDGFGDLAVTIEPQNARGDLLPQQVLVIRGAADGLATQPTLVLTRDGPDATFGGELVSPGDVDGDGTDDLLIESSCAFTDAGTCTAGRAYLYLGSPDGLSSDPAISLAPERTNFGYVQTLSAVGDIDGDGRADFAYGAYIYRGAPGGVADPHPRSL
jgi:hypothetical protein